VVQRWAVHWAEGTPLLPELFLAADRYVARQVDEAEDWSRPFAWGIRRLALQVGHDEAVLLECQARFKDGTKASIPEDAAAGELRADLGRILRTPGARATLYLAIPSDPSARFEPRMQEFQGDDGAQPVDIALRRPRFELLAVADDQGPPGYVSLPLARVGRAGRPGAEAEILPGFVPPLLTIDAWGPLAERLRQLAALVHARARRLAGQVAGRPLVIDPRLPEDIPRLLKLQALNAVDAYLRALAATPRLAPWNVYLGLARAAGQVALFTPDRHVAEVPEYRHDAPGEGFAELVRLIELALGEDEAPPFEAHPFRHETAGHLAVEFRPSWRHECRPILLGVSTDLAPNDCEHLLQSLDIAIASRERVHELFIHKLRGLDIRRAPSPPPGAPASGTVFFEFVADDRIFRDIAASQSMAIMVNPDIARFLDEQVVAAGSPPHDLRFGLYVFTASR
jgi:type VI secretion system protein ImpJ